MASYPLLSQAPTHVEVQLGCDNSSKRKEKKGREKAEEERKKRKAGETGNANSKNMRKDEPGSMVDMRRSLSGSLVPMTSPSRDYAQVSASPMNSNICPKTPF